MIDLLKKLYDQPPLHIGNTTTVFQKEPRITKRPTGYNGLVHSLDIMKYLTLITYIPEQEQLLTFKPLRGKKETLFEVTWPEMYLVNNLSYYVNSNTNELSWCTGSTGLVRFDNKGKKYQHVVMPNITDWHICFGVYYYLNTLHSSPVTVSDYIEAILNRLYTSSYNGDMNDFLHRSHYRKLREKYDPNWEPWGDTKTKQAFEHFKFWEKLPKSEINEMWKPTIKVSEKPDKFSKDTFKMTVEAKKQNKLQSKRRTILQPTLMENHV